MRPASNPPSRKTLSPWEREQTRSSRTKRLAIAVTLILGLASAVAAGAFHPTPTWQEIAWPFPQDAWPAGRAFRCRAAVCGGEMDVYLRPKLGFCANCATGVTDDAEVDGVADLDMMTDDFIPIASGEPVVIGPMAGRTRTYTLRFRNGAHTQAAGFAISRPKQCDLFIVASQGPAAGTQESRRAIETLLVSEPIASWVRQQLGG